jgi:hypothetical protein
MRVIVPASSATMDQKLNLASLYTRRHDSMTQHNYGLDSDYIKTHKLPHCA